jgi:GDP-L-fucose synthase
MLTAESKIYVAGHRGLLGSALVRRLHREGCNNLLLRTSEELDLVDQERTFRFLEQERPEYVFLSAARVGGINANIQHIGEFLYLNLQIELNVIEAARRAGVKKLLFVASTCIYPPNTESPISEEQLLTGPFEPTNEGYAVAKMAGIKMCELYHKQYGVNFISAIPCNLIGPNDQYEPGSSHVLQSLIRKIHQAKSRGEKTITIWGSGQPRREFMSSDDCADALFFLMNHYDEAAPINVGTGVDASIVELAQAVAEVLEYPIDIRLDPSKPDGMFRKLSDPSKIRALGWTAKGTLHDGIRTAYADFLQRCL